MIADFLKSTQGKVNKCLVEQLQHQGSNYNKSPDGLKALERLSEACQYSTLDGGKRIRAALFFATIDALGSHSDTHSGKQEPRIISEHDAALIASAIECIHSYSLVHDDLPALDNDELRRGKPTCHIAYDEALAILVGDGLQSLAFELLSATSLDSSVQIAQVRALAQAIGNAGMVGGQVIDLDSEDKNISLEELEHLHSLKTGALIRVSIELACIACKADTQTQTKLDEFAKAIGLAFQVHDDILDIESDTATLGKKQGADEALNKSTYPKLLGLEAAKAKAESLIEQAYDALDSSNLDTRYLKALAEFVISRKH